MAQIDIDKFVISLMRYFGNNKGIAITLDRCLFSLGLKYVDTPTGGRLERVDQPTMLEQIMWESGEQKTAENVEQKFKVGDIIRHKEQGCTCKITAIDIATAEYEASKSSGIHLPFEFQDAWELVEHSAWSEEDERMFNSALWHVKNSCGNGGRNSGEFEVYNWLKSIKARVKPKQELSKEDERDFNVIYGIIYNSCNAEDASRLIAWLKSIKDRAQPQPKQEWNEEDINMIDWLIRCCEKEHEELCNDKYGHQDIVSDLKRDCRKKWNWLESLKNRVAPQKQWKPSDEQLNSLYDVLNPCDGLNRDVLESLYNDLKKLKK